MDRTLISDWFTPETLQSGMISFGSAIVILLVGRLISRGLGFVVRQTLTKGKAAATVTNFVATLADYSLMTIVIIAALAQVGIETTSLAAVLGAAGLAVGFALRDTLANVAAGIMLVSLRPFRIGDYVEAAKQIGKVKAIGLFHTVVTRPDNCEVTIPNGDVFSSPITNFTHNRNRRIDLVMGISYSSSIDTARKIIEEVLKNHPAVLEDPEPYIGVLELADSSVNLAVRPYVLSTNYFKSRCELTEQLKTALENGGVNIPFPQRDVHLIPIP
jgi:small conductance mechanosensitive channel